MQDKESIKLLYREFLPSLSEEQIEKYADFMAQKYTTLKSGDDVVHLSYYSFLFDDNEIKNLEKILAESNLQLSRFDKNGVAYMALEDFMLQVSLTLNDPLVQNLLIGLGTNALWDTIKQSIFLIWQTVRNKKGPNSFNNNSKKKFNIGVKASLDKHTHFEFNIDSNFSDQIAIIAIDKILDFLKSAKPAEAIKRPDFVNFEENNKIWTIINVDAEIRKLIIKSKEEEKER